jgi:cobalamin synthase
MLMCLTCSALFDNEAARIQLVMFVLLLLLILRLAVECTSGSTGDYYGGK